MVTRIFTEEHKAKLSSVRAGRKISKEHYEKLLAGKKRWHIDAGHVVSSTPTPIPKPVKKPKFSFRELPRYGELKSVAPGSEAARIWHSRHEELPLLSKEAEFIDDGYHDHTDETEQGKAIWALVDDLTRRERAVIGMRFELDLTLDEIGTKLSIGRERVRQIEAKALRKLKGCVVRDELKKKYPKVTITNHEFKELNDYNDRRRGLEILDYVTFDIPETFHSIISFNVDHEYSCYLGSLLRDEFKETFGESFSEDMLYLCHQKIPNSDEDHFIFITIENPHYANQAVEIIEKNLTSLQLAFTKSIKP